MNSPQPQKAHRKGLPTTVKYLIGLLILAALFLVGFFPKYLNNKQLNSDAKAVSTTAPEIQIVTPRMAASADITLPGSVDAIQETSTQSRTTGYISKLYVDIGSHVKKGQILADVQSPDVDQQVAQAYAQTAQSRATVGQSMANVDSLRAVVLSGQAIVWHQRAALVQSQAALEGAISAKAQAQANLMVAKAKVAQSEQQVLVAKAAVTLAQANYMLAVASLKRETTLLKEGFVAQEDYDQSEASFKTNAATVGSAKANVQASEADVKASQETVQANVQTVRSAQSTEDSAAADIKAARANLESSIATLSAARSGVEAGRQTVQANQAAVGSSVANARRFDVLSSFDHVVAPFDGIITSRNVDVGSLVSPGAISPADVSNTTPTTGLFGIARVDTLRIYVSLPQTDFQWAQDGTQVKVLISELPNQKFKGVIHRTAGALDPATRTLLTEVRIPNPKGTLLPGMYAQVEFTPGAERKLRIPDAAIVVDSNGTRVIVVDATNHIHYQKVVLGRDYGTEAEVVTGVKASDRLVSAPSENMQDGGAVQILKGAAKS
jgi:RND family efflux transporter MFP subunit